MPEPNVMLLILFSFPEAMILGFLSLWFLGIRPSFYQLFQLGCLQIAFEACFFLYAAKITWLPFGTHMMVQVVFLSGIIWRIMRLSYKSSFLATILGFTVYVAVESLIFQMILVTDMYYQYFFINQEYLKFSGAEQLYYIMGNTILPIITLVIIRQLMSFIRNDAETKAQLNAFRHVEELLRTMRIQRHDFTQELQVVYGLLEVEEYQEAREYLKKSVREVSATSELVKTDNLGVTALLYTKNGLADALKIDLDIRVEVSMQQFPLEARDINFVLGNLIDNAMEAVAELPVPERKVAVVVRQDLEGYLIEVKNYGPSIPADTIEQLFAPGFSTKGEGRGMGLYSIQKLLHKYNGSISVRSDAQDTCFQIRIPVVDVSRQARKLNPFKKELQI